jgi:two-component system, LytTR family, sensor kinase
VLQNRYRFIYMMLAGVVIALILKILVFNRLHIPHPLVYDFLFTIICTMVIWESNIRFDALLNKRLPWIPNTAKRAVVQFATSLLVSSIVIYGMMYGYGRFICGDSPEHDLLMNDAILICILIISIVIIIEVCAQFFRNWKNSLLEIEKYKTETAQAQLQNLKNQINPHFLFNNMSVLSSLVYQNQDKAVDFINQLSKVYRYVLDNRNNELVTVQEEITFLASYIFLLQIRFDKNISFRIAIEKEHLQKSIPPMCLQVLVENCIKHNEISTEFPLQVSVLSEGNCIAVINNLQLRQSPEPSAKTGLQNIQDRYKYLSNEAVIISSANQLFTVKIPLMASV